jgi:hypothetical protein
VSEDHDAGTKALTLELILAVQLCLASDALRAAHDAYDAVGQRNPSRAKLAGAVMDKGQHFRSIGRELERAIAETDKLVPGLPHPGHEFYARIDRLKSILKERNVQVDERPASDHKS